MTSIFLFSNKSWTIFTFPFSTAACNAVFWKSIKKPHQKIKLEIIFKKNINWNSIKKTTYLKTLWKIMYLEFDLNENSKFDKYTIEMSWKQQIQNRIKTLNQ